MNSTTKSDLGDTVTDSFMTNENESDELFSDDEQNKEINYRSDVSLDISILRSKTPLLSIDNSNAVTPSNAVIPSTPLSLVPFLNKINEQWTSDLETPQADRTVQLHTKLPTNELNNTRETPKLEQHTPDFSSAKSIDKNIDKIISDSPVIAPTRAVRKRPKRRCIFKSSISTDISVETSSEYINVHKQEAPLVAESNTNLVARDNANNVTESISHIDSTHEDNIPQVSDVIQEICDNKNLNQLGNSVPDTLDLAQELSNNTFFNNVDELVFNSLDEQVAVDVAIQSNTKQDIANTHKEESQTLNLNKVERTEGVGFFTARGTAINVSKKALLKTKAMFANEMQTENREILGKRRFTEGKHLSFSSELYVPQLQLAEQSENYDKVRIKDSKQVFVNESSIKKGGALLFPHSTVNDIRSNVSEQASSRVKLSFMKEIDEPLESNIEKEVNNYDKENRSQEIKNSNIGFQTARGAPISISKQASTRAKLLFAKELEESLKPDVAEEASIQNKPNKLQEVKNLNIGFQTARGTPISISKQAFSKAKLLFAKELDEPLELNVTEEVNDETVKEQEIKSSSIGFQTARGASINISKRALSKAKLLFAKELTEPLEANVTREANADNKEVKDQEVKIPTIEFQTARGTPVNISKQALSRAKLLFAKELDEPLESNIAGRANISDREVKVSEVKTPNIGFHTVRDAPVHISKKALSRTKLLFAKELEEPLESDAAQEVATAHDKEEKLQELKTPNIGFQTARGTPVNISKQALSRAKLLFAKELDEPLESNIAGKANISDREVKVSEVKTSNIGFHTARDTPAHISRQALSRTKLLFAKELEEPLESDVAQEVATAHDKEEKLQELKTPNVGFQTARGTPVNISKQALSRAKLLFAKELDEPLEEPNIVGRAISDREAKVSEVKTPNIGFHTTHDTPVSKQALSRTNLLFTKELDGSLGSNDTEKSNIHNEEVKDPNVGFRTARGTSISVSEQAFSRAQALFADQLDSPAETNFPEKRKLSSVDSTPLGRGFTFGLKKPRLCNEFEGRRLFAACPSADTDEDVDEEPAETPSANLRDASRMSIDDDADDGKIETFHVTESSNKIMTNHAECLDQINQVVPAAGFSLRTPPRDTSELSEPDAVGSPVLGRQPVSRKRWSLEHRKGKLDAPRLDQTTSGDASTASAPPLEKKTDESQKVTQTGSQAESQAESQKVTQTDRQKAEGNSESAEYGDTQMMMDFIDESAQILQDRLAAALEQEKMITWKRRHRSKQSPGYLYCYKQTNSRMRISLRNLGNGAPPTPRTCQELIDRRIPPNILAITAATAASYKFRCSDFYGSDVARSNVHGIELEDGARLVMDENGYVGVWEILRAFLASLAVDPNLVPARWIENHYRWIVWKLASIDRMKFGSAELPRALTPSHVMTQLKYRYDREIDRSQRSAIRRILEKDDVASKRMILCVSSIVENNAVANSTMEVGKSPRIGMPKWKIELTDGWYSIPACIDIGMMKNVSTGKVREGTKLLICGAELLNCDVACYPLEAPVDACLKLHTNSTRRARWDLKLGYASSSGPIPVRLRDVCPNGGLIGKVTIVVVRVYPMLYHEKTASGESVMRNAKSEEKAQIEYEQRCRRKAEAFYDKAEKDFEEEDLSCETDLLVAQSDNNCKSSTQECARKNRQDELLRELRMKKERYQQELQCKLRESLPAPRQVSPLLKVRVCDGNASAILSVWSPGEEVVDVLKEGACVSLRNVIAAGKRGCELQLTARRCALFNPGTMSDASYPPRVCASFREVGNPEFSPPYGEFDTVGLVCAVGPAPYGMKDFEVAHLAYPKTDSSRSSSYLSILFWQRIASYGYAEIFTVGSIVACNNLEWRRATSWNVPVAYCTDRSIFTRNLRRNHLYESFENLRSSIADPIAYAEGCIAELNVELQKKPATTRTPTRYAPDKNTPIKIYNSAPGSDKRPVDHTPPLSTPRSAATTANNSWNFTASSSSIQKRLDKLQCYGEPPELSPIIIRSSKRVFLDYRSPVRVSGASSTTNTSSVNKFGGDSSNQSSLSPEKQ